MKICKTLLSAVFGLCILFFLTEMLLGADSVKERDNAHVIFYPQNTLSETGRIKADALTDYAVGYTQIRSKGEFSDASMQYLMSCIKKDPHAIPPLKLLLAKWTLDRSYQTLIDNLLPVAEKHPDALRLNVVVADTLVNLRKNEEAMVLLQKALNNTKSHVETKSDIKLLSEALTKLSGIYARLKKINEGEDLWDDILDNKRFADQLVIRIAAAAFFAEFADQGPDGFFAGWSKRRYRKKLEQNLAAIERICEKNKQSNALLLKPVLNIYKRYSMPERAEKLLFSMLLENPSNSSAMLMLAQSYSNFKQYSNSFRAWQTIIDSGRYLHASRYWKYLTRGRGGEGDFYRELAEVALRGGDLKEAVRAFDWFLLLHPEDPEALFQLGITYMRMNNFTKAILKFEQVEVLPEADFFRARSYLSENRVDKAMEALMDAEKTAAKYHRTSFLDDNFYTEYAFIADQAGDFKKAEEILQKLIKDTPDKPTLNNFMAYLWAEKSVNLIQAEVLVKKALKENADNSAYLDTLAWVLYKMKKYKDALFYIEQALDLEGEIPDAVIADHAGDIYYALNNKKMALKYWKMALGIYSENIDIMILNDKIDKIRNADFNQL